MKRGLIVAVTINVSLKLFKVHIANNVKVYREAHTKQIHL